MPFSSVVFQLHPKRRRARICDAMSTFEMIGIWAGLLALILAIPMGIVGTLLAPKVAAMWAMTTTKRRAQRIAVLKEQLEHIGQVSASPYLRQEYQARGMRFLAYGCVVTVYIFLLLIMEALRIHAHIHREIDKLYIFKENPSAGYFISECVGLSLVAAALYCFMRAIASFAPASMLVLMKRQKSVEAELKKLCG
jgi:hypothetical protein